MSHFMFWHSLVLHYLRGLVYLLKVLQTFGTIFPARIKTCLYEIAAGEILDKFDLQNLPYFWEMDYEIAGEILNKSNLQNWLDLLKMEAQLQEQQSRDKEIKAVTEQNIFSEYVFFQQIFN